MELACKHLQRQPVTNERDGESEAFSAFGRTPGKRCTLQGMQSLSSTCWRVLVWPCRSGRVAIEPCSATYSS